MSFDSPPISPDARARAYELLVDHLDGDQRRDWAEHRRFTVIASDESAWVIHDGRVLGSGEIPYNVDCVAGYYRGHSFCGYPRLWDVPAAYSGSDEGAACPAGDVLFAQKVLLGSGPTGVQYFVEKAQIMATEMARSQWPLGMYVGRIDEPRGWVPVG